MKLMILEKIRETHTCSSSPRAASVTGGTDRLPSGHPHIIPSSAIASALPCGARPGDGQVRLMEAASSNGSGDGRKRGSGGKERRNNQIDVMVAAGGNNSHRRSTAEMDDGI